MEQSRTVSPSILMTILGPSSTTTMRLSRSIFWLAIGLGLLVSATPSGADQNFRSSDEEVAARLEALARIYGYVRFFHPSDEASKVDWQEIAVYGAKQVLTSELPLHETLRSVFGPLAPTIRLSTAAIEGPALSHCGPEDAVVAWQHFGVASPGWPSVFQSRRVNRTPEATALFETLPGSDEVFEMQLADDLFLTMPLTVCVPKNVNLNTSADYRELVAKLDKLNVRELGFADAAVRVANTLIVWNVARFFYPYFDVVDADWDAALGKFLQDAVVEQSAQDHVDSLRRMVVLLKDGHGLIYPAVSDAFGSPAMRLDLIDKAVIVTASEYADEIPVGSEVLKIDDKSVQSELEQWQSLISGSKQTRTYRALNMLGSGPPRTDVKFEVRLPHGEVKVQFVNRDRDSNMYHGPPQFDYPAISKFEDNGYLINMRYFDESMLTKNLAKLARAPYVLIDIRWGAKDDTLFAIFGHLLDEPVESPKWLVPTIAYPNLEEIEFADFVEQYSPTVPRWRGKVAFITNASVVSSGETILAMVEAFDLAKIAGERTAGCNGNSNTFPLLGGLHFQWTGIRTIKHDGSEHHLRGIAPTHPVAPTLADIENHVDRALSVARQTVN